MAITRKGDMRKGTRRHSGRRKGDTEKIIIGGERDKKQEVTIRHEAVPQKKASSVWSWHEEFAREWSGTFLLKKQKKSPKKGE
jgi:hypothetical protein